jgi:hypothetical protein|tara:strand:- start:371 stop:694 length:324 start_codon:yes stop_codon:yes gene_type:complete
MNTEEVLAESLVNLAERLLSEEGFFLLQAASETNLRDEQLEKTIADAIDTCQGVYGGGPYIYTVLVGLMTSVVSDLPDEMQKEVFGEVIVPDELKDEERASREGGDA